MALSLPVTAESVSRSIHTLLTTHDSQIRSETDRWLADRFRASPDAWEVCLILLDHSPSNVVAPEVQVFAAQTLYTKLGEHVDQIFADQERCLHMCRFLMTQCLLQPPQQQQNSSVQSPPQNSSNKPVRLKLSECLAVAVVTFLGAHWPTAISDILNSAPLASTNTSARGQLIASANLLHTIGALPNSITVLEYKKLLMALLGYPQYTPWRKTKAAKTLKSDAGIIGDVVAIILDGALTILEQQVNNTSQHNNDNNNNLLATEVIHEALTAMTNWSKTFGTSFVVTSPRFSDSRLLWKLVSVYGNSRDFSLPEMFSAAIPTLPFISSQPPPNSLANNDIRVDAVSIAGLPSCVPFSLECLGLARSSVEVLLVFFVQNLLAPLSALCQGSSSPSLDRIESFGGSDFLSYIYHWIIVVYDLSIIFPSLLLRQSNSLQSFLVPNQPTVIPANLLLQLMGLASLLHPLTHLKLLELWNDMVDIHRDRLLTEDDLDRLITELGEVTVKSVLRHSRRDSPVWDPCCTSSCADPSDKNCYIETSQDAIIRLYYLYSHSSKNAVADHRSDVFLQQLTDTFTSCCDRSDISGAAVVLGLLGSIIETVIDLSKSEVTRCLVTVCQRVPLDAECVETVVNVIKTQSVFLTKDSHTSLWTSMFECLMRVFKLSPRLCAEAAFDLCDCGGTLGLQQVPNPRDLIRNFYMLIDSISNSLPESAIEFEPPLYAALAALVRQLGTDDAPQVFAESLKATVSKLESILPNFVAALSTVNMGDWESKSRPPQVIQDGILLLRRLSRAINSLESKQAESLSANLRDTRLSFVQALLFGDTSNQPQQQQQQQALPWKICCTAAGALLGIQVVHKKNGLIVPGSDCYEKRKLEKKIWARGPSPELSKNLALHFLRQTIRSTPIDKYPLYWDFVINLTLHQLQLTNKVECVDLSVGYALTDIVKSIVTFRSEDPISRLLPTDPPLDKQIVSTLAPCLIRHAAVKAQAFPVSLWGFNMKPLFDFALHLIPIWDMHQSTDEATCSVLVQVSVKALECPSKRVQRNVFVLLTTLLNSKNSCLRRPTVVLYPEMVKAFWCSCHLWESPNMTAICNLSEALIRFKDTPPESSKVDNSENERFISQSRTVMMTMRLSRDWRPSYSHSERGNTDGLMSALSERDCNFVLELFKSLRSLRLRQLLMDLVKIGKRVQTPDSLVSYELMLNDLNTQKKQQKDSITECVDLD